MENKKTRNLALIAIIILVLVGGGYYVYFEKNKETKDEIPALNNLNEATSTSENTNKTETLEKVNIKPTNTTVVTATRATCNENWDCLITAAKTCQPTIGTFSYSDIPHPMSSVPYWYTYGRRCFPSPA
jgi:uncharacterized protein YpuA (DUF1002 family)